MLLRVAVDLGGASKKEARFDALGKTQHVVGAKEARFEGLDGVGLVVDRAGGACQVVDLVDLEQQRVNDVVAYKFKVGVANPVVDVGFGAGEVIVKADDVVTKHHEAVHQMRAHKAGAASDKNALFVKWVEVFHSRVGGGGGGRWGPQDQCLEQGVGNVVLALRGNVRIRERERSDDTQLLLGRGGYVGVGVHEEEEVRLGQVAGRKKKTETGR